MIQINISGNLGNVSFLYVITYQFCYANKKSNLILLDLLRFNTSSFQKQIFLTYPFCLNKVLVLAFTSAGHDP